ncbi:MAG: secondary thiamine-phosphate synthase enzyme YjbQ [Candidatus Omnitrophica bacterium]|nr:secondary thiamine-phosphate synthase enzyme YjbQ [Candidatus Omnitrophota bacterium]MBU1128746.1 secondary thiamine-phosphate synthase enzyme YjbQ [Candidatus Omnitrophota bacterium]MBU1783998.1 secondary thiamine-phosphate synthase enzyme YjbQ [Candidatus Omnitrophota bacterium]MBU1851775.1 secondary thiamine-phosphate synthase enzyme YjbQ [Candidatus Omnitrophota bacterium]
MVITKTLRIQTRGDTDILDITPDCGELVRASGLKSGVLTVFSPGSTGGISTIEYEPNLVKDLKEALEMFAPSGKAYEHGKTWNDDNGSSHIRSTMMGPSFSVPFVDGELTLGTWQQIIFCDFDTRPRGRELVLQAIGE